MGKARPVSSDRQTKYGTIPLLAVGAASPESVSVTTVVLCSALMCFEVIAGYASHSFVVFTLVVHNISVVVIYFLSSWHAKHPASQNTFGCVRAEVVGTFLALLTIWSFMGALLLSSLAKVIHIRSATVIVNSNLVSIVGLIAVGIHSFCATSAIRSAWGPYVHAFGVLVVGLCLGSSSSALTDAVSAIVFGLGALFVSSYGMMDLMRILMEAAPSDVDSSQVELDLRELPGVVGVRDLHIWSLSTGKVVLCVHLVSNLHEQVLRAAQILLNEKYKISHLTIQLDLVVVGTNRCAVKAS